MMLCVIVMLGIGVVGMPGSGKSILSEVARRINILVLNMGDAVREEVLNRGLELTSENLMQCAEDLRKKYGRGAVAILITEKLKRIINTPKPKAVVIEGLRSPEEKAIFEKFFDKFYVVAIHASPKIRYERILARNRPDDFTTISELRERDLRELSFGIGELLAMADFHLVNEGKTPQEFADECEKLIKKILGSNC